MYQTTRLVIHGGYKTSHCHHSLLLLITWRILCAPPLNTYNTKYRWGRRRRKPTSERLGFLQQRNKQIPSQISLADDDSDRKMNFIREKTNFRHSTWRWSVIIAKELGGERLRFCELFSSLTIDTYIKAKNNEFSSSVLNKHKQLRKDACRYTFQQLRKESENQNFRNLNWISSIAGCFKVHTSPRPQWCRNIALFFLLLLYHTKHNK